MGDYTDNYNLRHKYDSETQTFRGSVEHKELDELKVFEDINRDILYEEMRAYMSVLDNKYISNYNKLRENNRNYLYKNTSYNTDLWLDIKRKKRIGWKRKSEIILYGNLGKPEYYLDIKNNKSKRKPSKLLLFLKKLFIDNVEDRYKVNLERYVAFKKELGKWDEEYNNYIDDLMVGFENNKPDIVELYYKVFLKDIQFKIDKHIKVEKNIFNFLNKKSSIHFDSDEKVLTINYFLVSENEITDLLYDKRIKSLGEYEVWLSDDELKRRITYIYYQIILGYISSIFNNDKSLNKIDSIYFNAWNSNNCVEIELIFNKNELSRGQSYSSIDDIFIRFNRNRVLFTYLEREGVTVSESLKDGSKIIIRETKIDDKIISILSRFQKLKILYLIRNDLDEIPKSLYDLSNLEELHIISNNLKVIPKGIDKFFTLKVLSFKDNKVRSFSDTIFNCKFLKELNLSQNNITNLSTQQLKNLLYFDICVLDENKVLANISNNIDNSKDIIIELIKLQEDRQISSVQKILKEKDTEDVDENKTLIITEGKTDWKHLKKALERFQMIGLYKNLNIEFDEYENISMSDSELDNYAEAHAKKRNSQKLICIFDRDLPKRVEEYGQSDFIHVFNRQLMNKIKNECKKEYGDNSKKYLEIEEKLDSSQYEEIDSQLRKILRGEVSDEWETQLNNNVYAFCIPKLDDKLDEICIEFYYKEKDLKKENSEGKRLFTADEFEFTDKVNNCNRFVSKCGKFKTDTQSGSNQNREVTLQYPNKNKRGYVYKIGEEECIPSNNMNLSKNDFVKNIINEVEGFDNFDIENFKLIFDVIEKIIEDV